MIPIHLLTGPAHECIVPRELRFELAPWQQSEKPLWAWDEAFDAIGALEDAGAAVVQGEIVVVSDGGEVSRVPWEPWLEDAPLPEYPPTTRGWYCMWLPDEPWREFVARAASHARSRALALVGEARTTPAGTIHLDLSWAMHDELALFDLPGWVRPQRRRLRERGAGVGGWHGLPSFRMRCVGPRLPGSYFGSVSNDLAQIPLDARYASFTPRTRDFARLAEMRSLEVVWATGCTDRTLPLVGRLATVRELYLPADTRVSSLEPVTGLAGLWFAAIHTGRHLTDPRPLEALSALRYLRLSAPGLRDLSGFGGLTQLNSLHLIPARTVHSLAPLAALANLRHLSVWMEAVRAGGLAPLAEMRRLRSLGVDSSDFALEEFARLAVALPGTDGPHRSPFYPPDGPVPPERCRRCRRADLYVTIGKPTRELCPECAPLAVRRHVVRWEILLSAAAASSAG